MIDLASVKKSLRVSHSEDDDMLQGYIDISKAYIIASIDSTLTEDDFKDFKQFDFAVSLLTEWYYLNRGQSTTVQIPTGVTAMIQQLRGVNYGTDQ